MKSEPGRISHVQEMQFVFRMKQKYSQKDTREGKGVLPSLQLSSYRPGLGESSQSWSKFEKKESVVKAEVGVFCFVLFNV